jgi:outer membrane biosynthesis protein TonB
VDFPSCADLATNYSAPKLNKQVEPKMSDAAKKAKKQGVVWIIADVGKDGAVQKANLAGGDADLNPSAQEAVQQYKYTPYTRCGQAVAFQTLTLVPFRQAQANNNNNQGSVVTGH